VFNVKINMFKKWDKGMDCIGVHHEDWDRWRAVVNAVINIRVL
jgi:hypothetical protein